MFPNFDLLNYTSPQNSETSLFYCSPQEVQQQLETTARDLGLIGRDNLYGAGLVNAEKAVTY